MAGRSLAITLFRLAVAVACSAPAAWLVVAWHRGTLGANPPEAVVLFTGQTGLILLLATIALGPAFRLSGWPGFMAVRRQLGLWALFWLLGHMLAWMGLDQYWEWYWIGQEIRDLPYVRYGLIGLVLLVPLALTSFRAAEAAMGRRAWQWLHRLVYVAAALGVVHQWMIARWDYSEAMLAAGVLAALIVFRLACALIDRR